MEEFILQHIHFFLSILPPHPGAPHPVNSFSLGVEDDLMNSIGSDNQGPPGPSVSVTNFIAVRFEYYL